MRPPAARAAVPAAAGDGRHHDVLHVPHVVPDLRRQAARPPRLRTRPRVAVADDGAADRPGGLQRLRGLGLAAVGRRGELAGASAAPRAADVRASPTSASSRRRARWAASPTPSSERQYAQANHGLAGDLALGHGRLGHRVRRRCSTTTACSTRPRRRSSSRGVHAFLTHKWYFDELYSVAARAAGAGRRRTGVQWFDLDGDRRRHPRRRPARRSCVAEVGRPVRQRHRRRPGQPGRPT